MAKFAYRMQSILDIKEKMEGQAKIAYGVANAKLMDEQGKLQQIMIRKAGYESQARNLVNGTIDVPKIKECKRAVDSRVVLLCCLPSYSIGIITVILLALPPSAAIMRFKSW